MSQKLLYQQYNLTKPKFKKTTPHKHENKKPKLKPKNGNSDDWNKYEL